MQQHGDDGDVAVQRSHNLQPDHVIRVIETPPSCSVGRARPCGTDQREQHVARADALIDHPPKILSGRDVGDVEENALRAEIRFKSLEQPSRVAFDVLAPIADEDACHIKAVALLASRCRATGGAHRCGASSGFIAPTLRLCSARDRGRCLS